MSVTECDCCKAENAEQRCAKCKCAYYCSRECQKKDWPTHKRTCAEFAKSCTIIESGDRNMDSDISTREQSKIGECAICLDPLRENPLGLPCKHIFCGPCILEHQKYIGRAVTCPLCRSKLPNNLYQYVYVNATNLFNRGYRSPVGSETRARFCRLARAELEAIKEHTADSYEIQSLYADLLYAEGRYSEAIDASEALIDKNPPQVMLLSNIRNCISANLQLQKYAAATSMVKEMFRIVTHPAQFVYDTRFMYQAASECFYGLGKYAESIEYGNAAIELNRHYEGVHRSVALSHKALGNYPEAVRTMQRAVRYETPWDEVNVQRCKDLLSVLVEESRKVGESKDEQVADSVAETADKAV